MTSIDQLFLQGTGKFKFVQSYYKGGQIGIVGWSFLGGTTMGDIM